MLAGSFSNFYFVVIVESAKKRFIAILMEKFTFLYKVGIIKYCWKKVLFWDVHGSQAYTVHDHAETAQVMSSHIMHTHAVHCMFYVRSTSEMPTVAAGPKAIYQHHANSFVQSSF
jgi:hypothetical protein